MKLDIGVSLPVQCEQLAILTGHSSDDIQPGHAFRWGKGMFRVESINDSEAVILRLGSEQIHALDQTKVLNPSQFHPLDAGWHSPGAEFEGLHRKQKGGEFVDVTKSQRAGGDTVVKVQVFPRELKTPRPGVHELKLMDDEPRTSPNP